MFLHKLCKLRLVCIDTECLHADMFFFDLSKEHLCPVRCLYYKMQWCPLVNSTISPFPVPVYYCGLGSSCIVCLLHGLALPAQSAICPNFSWTCKVDVKKFLVMGVDPGGMGDISPTMFVVGGGLYYHPPPQFFTVK